MTDTGDDEDPFEGFDAPDDADPFADLPGPDDADETESDESDATDPGPATSEDDEQPRTELADDPFTQPGDSAGDAGESVGDGNDGTPGASDDEDASDDPFAAFRDPSRSSDPDDDPFGAFEPEGVDEVDPDLVWEALSSSDEDGMPEFDEKVYYEVSKHKYCERCEYFSGPPETTCTYDGAAIVEFLDMETVRLLNCPIVAEQRELEENVSNLG